MNESMSVGDERKRVQGNGRSRMEPVDEKRIRILSFRDQRRILYLRELDLCRRDASWRDLVITLLGAAELHFLNPISGSISAEFAC